MATQLRSEGSKTPPTVPVRYPSTERLEFELTLTCSVRGFFQLKSFFVFILALCETSIIVFFFFGTHFKFA